MPAGYGRTRTYVDVERSSVSCSPHRQWKRLKKLTKKGEACTSRSNTRCLDDMGTSPSYRAVELDALRIGVIARGLKQTGWFGFLLVAFFSFLS